MLLGLQLLTNDRSLSYEDSRNGRAMSIVTISRGSYSRGKEVAEKLARIKNYDCVSREIILAASEHFDIPEVKLIRAIHDAPSILDRFTYGREKYITFFRATLLRRVQKDDTVYHGLGGQFFLQSVPHVLKVRIICNLEDRVREEMRREKISQDEARRILVKDDEERRRWSMHLDGIDIWDPRLYDLTLHIDTMGVDDALAVILQTLDRPCFKTTQESRRLLDDLTHSALMEALLVEEFPKATAVSKNGEVFVSIRAPMVEERSIVNRVKEIARKAEGVKTVHVNIVPFVIEGK